MAADHVEQEAQSLEEEAMLTVCGTPIGNLGDVTPRVLDALRAADLVAAEDTRHTRKLLTHFGIHTPLTSLFRHNEARKTEEVLGRLRDGSRVALVTDAGMPGVQDPGARLISQALEEGLGVVVLPGPSAVTTALVASGLSGGAFRFVGYLPRRPRELETALHDWRRSGGVVVAFETGRRLARSLSVLADALPEAKGAVCRELTKVNEEVVRGTLVELSERYSLAGSTTGTAGVVRGEITLVLDLGAPLDDEAASWRAAEAAAGELLRRGLSRRDAAAAVQVCLGLLHREAEALVRTVADRR